MSLRATEETRRIVKKPLGTLLKADSEIRGFLKGSEKPLITVGDIVSASLIKMGFEPHLCIVDGKTMRKSIEIAECLKKGRRILMLKNPPGTISEDSWKVIREAVSSPKSTIIVEGEEDLLTLVAIQSAPEGSLVLYGQPGEGVVAIRVDESSRKMVSKILGTMTSNV
ncbi:MAG: GTP-dependent dephospho-CoA kinase family protein [Crenarchaeota archaeon]|nr:GTP-dependent dephospho-CoA kinase family protein [Thermoproteota archaeon]MDW8033702.1 GTP-dependent dephospho-CoA kinase family protein [Nitrososphaerota archaeon]